MLLLHALSVIAAWDRGTPGYTAKPRKRDLGREGEGRALVPMCMDRGRLQSFFFLFKGMEGTEQREGGKASLHVI